MSDTRVDVAFVREAARLAGLDVPAAAMPAVLANLERIEGFARVLETVPLEPADEPATVWRP